MKYVFMVQFAWSTTDADGIETELFDTYEKAFARFNEIIANEKNPEMSWAAEAFNDDGTEKDNYIFDCETDGTTHGNLWWNLTDKDNWNIHEFLDLKKMEVN